MFRRCILVLVFSIAALSGGQERAHAGEFADRCGGDVEKFCHGYSTADVEAAGFGCLNIRLGETSLNCQVFMQKLLAKSDPCTTDAFLHCPKLKLNLANRRKCLGSLDEAVLTPACRKYKEEYDSKHKLEKQVCGTEFAEHCPEPSQGYRCGLSLYLDEKLSPKCHKLLTLLHPDLFKQADLALLKTAPPLLVYCSNDLYRSCESEKVAEIEKSNYACLMKKAKNRDKFCERYLAKVLKP